MTLKTYFSVIACFILLISCRDNKSHDDVDRLNTEENEFSPVDRNIPREDVEEEDFEDDSDTTTQNAALENSRKQNPNGNVTSRQDTGSRLTGTFIKIGNENDTSCGCYCLDLSAGNAELCIVEGKMFINTRLQKNANNTIDVFLVEPAARNTQGKDMPWKDFDRNSAIATIQPSTNGELEFDWLGFKINGDIAVDYAILGKKTLEGKYKKK